MSDINSTLGAPPPITVEQFLRGRSPLGDSRLRLPLEIVAGHDGLQRVISSPHIQKTGLVLAGFHDYLKPGRVLVFGESEMHFLETLPSATLPDVLPLDRYDIPCVLVTAGLRPSPGLQAHCASTHVPLLRTSVATPLAISRVGLLLEDYLAEQTVVHGVLLDVLGLGVLVTGESGIGKSESALDLIVRGHRLVADDVVEVRRRSDTLLVGSCPELTRYHMEIRGLGIINVKELFGVAATRASVRIELAVHLERWDASREYDRLGLSDPVMELLGLRIPLVRMPVAPGRNLAILVEVAARNQLLRAKGVHTAQAFADRWDASLRATSGGAPGEPTADEEDA